MAIFDNWSRFFEQRLEEFLKNNPLLELQVILDELTDQEQDTANLIIDLEKEEKRRQDEILSIAKEIEKWHERVRLAESLGKQDLAQAAKERESALLNEGNQTWVKMTSAKERQAKTRELLAQIKTRKQEIKTKLDQLNASKKSDPTPPKSASTPPNQTFSSKPYSGGYDSLDEQFNQLEMDDEIERLKRNPRSK